MIAYLKRLTHSIRRGFACEARIVAGMFTAGNGVSRRMRGLRKLLCPWVHSPYVFLFLLLCSVAFGKDIIVRTSHSPESVWVGQRVTLQIDVLGKDGWAQITDLDHLQIDGCYILPSGNSRVRLQEKIEGADYSGQRYELSIYPQRNGTIKLPKLALDVNVQTWGASGGTDQQVAYTEPTTLEARLPEGVTHAHSFIASPNFKATQTWSNQTNDATAGDALKRNIQLKATELPAMVLPPLSAPEIDHLSVYQQTPELIDDSKDHSPTGQRNETITYVFESNGAPELPDYQFQWWNTETETLSTITLEGRTIQITGAPVTPSNSVPQTTEASPSRTTAILIGILFLCTAGGYIYYRHSRSKIPLSLERELFLTVTSCDTQQSPAELIQQTTEWIQVLTSKQFKTLKFLETFTSVDISQTAVTLLQNPSANIPTSELSQFQTGLKTARKLYQQSQQTNSRLIAADAILPKLN